MNETIQTILNHRSIRSFEDKPLTDEQIRLIVQSAQAASTSSFVQAYTIIGVKDPQKKAELAKLSGNQSYVEQNGHFFVFCLDFHRHELASQMEGIPVEQIQTSLESTEMFLVGAIDATLAAQNACIAAESMGLGICYIGGLRNHLREVCELLQTPDRVIPLFGLCVGVPAKNPSSTKQRLPLEHVYHEDQYNQDTSQLQEQLQGYNQDISEYYRERTGGKRADRWTEQMARQLSKPKRLYLKKFLAEKKLPLD